MAFNINDIRAQLAFGGARPSLFQVIITNPRNAVADLKTPFMVQAASIPPSQMGTIEVPYFGRKIKIAGDRTFSEWTTTIINDEDFLVRNALEEWSNDINGLETNVRRIGSPAPSAYKSTATVTQFGKTGVLIRTYQLNGIWPSDIQAIELDWNTTDDIERFTTTWQYDSWEVVGGVTGNAGGV